MSTRTLRIRVIGTDLPALASPAPGQARAPIFVGIQRGRDVINITSADRPQVTFDAEFEIGTQPDGRPNFLGPYAQGSRHDRFFYLCWGTQSAGHFAMFRRLKIRVGHLSASEIDAAIAANTPIHVHLTLTDHKGGPLCATPPPTHIRWD